MGRKKTKFTEHAFLPDFQIKPGVRTDHMEWIPHFLAEKEPDTVIFAGDWADMPSLSSYDKGKKSFEGRRYTNDINAFQRSVDRFFEAFEAARAGTYWPRFVFLTGNHEDRISRAVEYQPELEGLISIEQDIHLPLKARGVECYQFLDITYIDGIAYSHYFVNTTTLMKRVVGGTIDNRLKALGHSFTMGHQQTLMYGLKYGMGGKCIHGLVAGACYLHNEEYMGPQGNDHWRGMVYKHEVRDGSYDPMMVSLDYLRRRYS